MCSRCPSRAENTGGKTFTPLFYSTVNQLLINLVPITRDALLEMPGVRLKFSVSSILVSNFFNPLYVHFFSGEFDYIYDVLLYKCLVFPYNWIKYLSSSENGIVMIFYVTAQRIFNRFCQNQITNDQLIIHLRIFTESFVKFVQKLWEIYGKNKYITFF